MSPAVPQEHDELLSVEVAASQACRAFVMANWTRKRLKSLRLPISADVERLGVSKDYLYRHARDYSFTRRQGRKLLFSALGIEKHISQKRP